MRILKLIAISIIETRAKAEVSNVRVSLGERLVAYKAQGDIDGASIVVEVQKEKEKEIKEWKEEWIGRIEKL